MQYVIDIDETLLFCKRNKCNKCGRINYKYGSIDIDEIKRVNKLYDGGHIIILYTGRGWDVFKETVNQLKVACVKYHSLVMGKPLGIYVDKDSIKTLKDINDNQAE